MIGDGSESDRRMTTNLSEGHSHRVKKRERRTGREFRLNALVEGHEIKDVMLDLGSDVNIFPKKSWEAMVKPKVGIFTYSADNG